MTTARRLLLILRQPPYTSVNPREAIDVALVAAAFEFEVSVLFEGRGVWQLLAGQHGAALDQPTHGDALAELPRHEVTRFYVCADALAAAGLGAEALVLPVEPLSHAAQRALVASHEVVITD
ncbi:MAG: DsrE family protein [Pseudomonadales bacterium]|nr:DsrE family protein [Pseudomonadales bacterium]